MTAHHSWWFRWGSPGHWREQIKKAGQPERIEDSSWRILLVFFIYESGCRRHILCINSWKGTWMSMEMPTYTHGGSGLHVVWPPKDKDTSSYYMSNKISSTPHQNLSWIRIPHFKKGRGTGWVGRFMPKLMEVHGSPWKCLNSWWILNACRLVAQR